MLEEEDLRSGGVHRAQERAGPASRAARSKSWIITPITCSALKFISLRRCSGEHAGGTSTDLFPPSPLRESASREYLEGKKKRALLFSWLQLGLASFANNNLSATQMCADVRTHSCIAGARCAHLRLFTQTPLDPHSGRRS